MGAVRAFEKDRRAGIDKKLALLETADEIQLVALERAKMRQGL
jgi:hypothetical protein